MTTTSPLLRPLQQSLANAFTEDARRQAAAQIIDAYCSFYNRTAARQQMDILFEHATSIAFVEPAAMLLREQEQVFFYEFSLLMMEAVYIMAGK